MIDRKHILAGSFVAGAVALGAALWALLSGPDRAVKDIVPDALPQAPTLGKTGYKRIDAILGKLQSVAQATGIPLGLLVGWIAKESGGKLADHTSLDERGYFQLMPAESKSIGVDHERLSTDSDYSIDAGIKLIRRYQSSVNDLNLAAAPAGSSFYWKLVKLGHSMGAGQMRKVVSAAKDAGQAKSWEQLEQFAIGMSIRGPQPKKWFPFVDSVYKIGQPFGFGNETAMVAGFAEHAPVEMLMGLVDDGENCGFDMLGAESV